MALDKRIILLDRLDRDGPSLESFLVSRGFRVYSVIDESELLGVVRLSQPDVAIVAGQPTLALVSQLVGLGALGSPTLVIVLWAGAPVAETTRLLEMGVDYVAASFQPDWLASQIRALLRRCGRDREAQSEIDLGYLRIDLRQRKVNVDNREVPLTRTEFDVLRVLAERPGTVLPSGEIMQQVMGVRTGESEAQDLLKVHIHRLRQKLERDYRNPKLIRTVRGHGYMYAFERRLKDRSGPKATTGM